MGSVHIGWSTGRQFLRNGLSIRAIILSAIAMVVSWSEW